MKFGLWHSSWWSSNSDDPDTFSSYERAHAKAGQLNKEFPKEYWVPRNFERHPWKHAADRACPCLYTNPCDSKCTCMNPGSSRGCDRCCSYGSAEQRRLRAEQIVSVFANVDAERVACVRKVIDALSKEDTRSLSFGIIKKLLVEAIK